VFKRIHIILIPGNSGAVRQFRMCWVLPVFMGLLALSWMGFCGWALVDYQITRQKVLRLTQLEMENERGKREFLRFAESIDQIRERISEHRDLDQKIQEATKLDPGEDFSRYKGMGGSDPSFSLSRLPTPKTNRKMVSSLYRALDALNSEIGIGKRTKARLHDLLERREEVLTLVSTTRPTEGRLTSAFGYRTSPFSGKREFHHGIDLATRRGTPILAPADGLVESVGWKYGYGRMVTIDHGYGLVTRYAHLHKAFVSPGDSVKTGQKIALVGNSGQSTGPHLHYEVHLNGVPQNPIRTTPIPPETRHADLLLN
jgi:murein DD-endopeptidase MepM/ murein hydrolase activator NlpD